MTFTLDNWEFEPDKTNNRIIIRSLDSGEEYFLNEDGTTNVDANTLQGNSPDDLSAGITSTQHVTTFDEPYVSISGYDTVIDGSIETDTAYAISVASFTSSLDVSAQDTIVTGLTWNNDGSKMYMIGNGDDEVNEYDVSTAFDISTATFSTTFSVNSEDGLSEGMSWNDDGSKMYIAGGDTSSLYEYDLTTNFDISTASFSGTSFDVSTQLQTPTGMEWNNDGSKMYISTYSDNSIHEYDVSTAYDLSTATFSQSFDVSAQDTVPEGMSWNDTGSKLYMVGSGNDRIYEYDVTTNFDISTASLNTSFDISGQDSSPSGMTWNDDGTSLYALGDSNDSIYQYDISTPTNPTSTVTVDNPDDVFEWDTATFESDPAVTVNLLDESGTTLLTDIGADTDISAISSNENFQFELNFDTSTSTPSVDYLARRFVGGEDDSLKAKGYTDVASNRSIDTDYTNTTANPLLVTVTLSTSSDGWSYGGQMFVDSNTADDVYVNESSSNNIFGSGTRFSLSAIVPSGSTYRVAGVSDGGDSVNKWVEQELTVN